ncbi:hypothetical protein HER10_EVM0001408 [Colletotrichum scovillei]|uniref:uncharacterized protein n=1 Tax=Colletotrichum scovillei TaxID=1209932 RepID=UPI0015C2D101|nr:uncharacterized protein HER10_EVM0001408 [Colletotrichum scovillei]KAF4783889.1 hypothetical protein HER10_EVM0001408 [Colletotrichum scovillei]
MDAVYWDIFPDAEDAEDTESLEEEEEEVYEDTNACSPDIKVPCDKCRRKKRSSCKRCRKRQRQLQLQHQPSPHTHPRRTRKSSLEIACFPDRSSSSYSSSSSNSSHLIHTSPPSTSAQDAIPEVILQQPPDDIPADTTTQKNTLTVPLGGPSFAAVYTNSPSWMSTYTSSTCSTTYTTIHERSRRDGLGSGEKDAGDGWLDVRRRRRPRPPYPRRPRTVGRWDQEGRSSMTAVTSSMMRSRWGEETVEGWDEAEMESGSYCVVEGARWEEQRFITSRRAAKAVGTGMGKSGARRRGRGHWRGVVGYGAKRRARAVSLVDPPVPRIMFDLLAMRMGISKTGLREGENRALWGLPFVDGRGHSRVVFTMAYVRGTAHVKGLWGLLSDKCDDTGGFFGSGHGGGWSVVLRYLAGILGFYRREGQDDVD